MLSSHINTLSLDWTETESFETFKSLSSFLIDIILWSDNIENRNMFHMLFSLEQNEGILFCCAKTCLWSLKFYHNSKKCFCFRQTKCEPDYHALTMFVSHIFVCVMCHAVRSRGCSLHHQRTGQALVIHDHEATWIHTMPLTLWMLGNFLKIDYIVVCFLKPLNSACFLMGNDRLSGKQVGSQARRRVTRRLAWIQPVWISINAVPALKGLTINRYALFISRLHCL